MTQKKQYYVIRGRRPGLYDRWFGEAGAAEQVDGLTVAVFKGFYTLQEAALDMHDERKMRLHQITGREGPKFRCEYDFGDSWLHQVLVEKTLSLEPGQDYPLCIEGRRGCPPEDVGGIWAYYCLLEAIGDPDHEEHNEYLKWVGGEFDPV